MKARQLKKLSKKIAAILPDIYKESWIDDEVMESAWEQGTKVSNEIRIGGESDCWGEGTDDYSVFTDFVTNIDTWAYPYPSFPDGHEFERMPDLTRSKKMTGKLSIEHAKVISRLRNETN